jgi:hypothetical protein
VVAFSEAAGLIGDVVLEAVVVDELLLDDDDELPVLVVVVLVDASLLLAFLLLSVSFVCWTTGRPNSPWDVDGTRMVCRAKAGAGTILNIPGT